MSVFIPWACRLLLMESAIEYFANTAPPTFSARAFLARRPHAIFPSSLPAVQPPARRVGQRSTFDVQHSMRGVRHRVRRAGGPTSWPRGTAATTAVTARFVSSGTEPVRARLLGGAGAGRAPLEQRRRRASSELAHLTAVKLTSGASSSGGVSAGAGAGVSKGAGVGVCKDGRESARARKGFLAFSFCALSCACHSRCRA